MIKVAANASVRALKEKGKLADVAHDCSLITKENADKVNNFVLTEQ